VYNWLGIPLYSTNLPTVQFLHSISSLNPIVRCHPSQSEAVDRFLIPALFFLPASIIALISLALGAGSCTTIPGSQHDAYCRLVLGRARGNNVVPRWSRPPDLLSSWSSTCYFAAIELTSHGQMESRCVYFVVGVFIKNVLYPGQQYASRLRIQRLVSTTGSIGFSTSALFFFSGGSFENEEDA
jgi:hypothetical protein